MGEEEWHTLQLDFVLQNKGLARVVDRLVEFGRDGVVGSDILDDCSRELLAGAGLCGWVTLTESLVALNSLEDSGFLDGPLADIGPLLLGGLVGQFLLGVADLPPRVPVVGELFIEGSADGQRLDCAV